ncbi:MAG: 16S rRNA (cytidine(1402)-2'-O)-methyltransferase [Clostridia bacterium]|nr:16S rRNA (cytidine(1402)-2'-O)-methyltransferase [Clostridia bacterium]
MSTEDKNRVVGGMLYLVATPIGNLSDLSPRAIKVLSEVDFVAAEDTRNSGLLLSRFDISKPMVSYFEHNKRERGEIIVERILAGESCALVTDAGTPAISDPGEDIVALCAERGVPVTSIPGACAAVTALSVSGLPTGRFVFEGFITTVKNDRRERLMELASEKRTLILYEAPHKLRATLNDLLKYWGDRRISLCREITKLNEEILRTTIAKAVELYAETDPRGEYVLVVEGAKDAPADAGGYPEDPAEHVRALMESGMERMDAIKSAAKERGMSKGAFYKLLLGTSAEE